MLRPASLALLFVAAMAASVAAESLNVDFGAGNAPASSYNALGRPGVWNSVGVLASGVRAPLVDLAGNASAARIYMIGGTALLDSDDPLTSGEDESLMDDMLIGYNDPVDVCVWVENLANGEYGVILYAMTPNDPSLDCRTRVDAALEGPTQVGGAWPGAHEEGVTYSFFHVTVTNGTIGLHSGLYGGLFQSGLNGMQIVDLTATSAALGPSEAASMLRAYPNPARGAQTLELVTPRHAGSVSVEIVDVTGRIVWRDALVADAPGPLRVIWDGTDAAGRRVPGVYFARIRGAAVPERSVKLVRQE